MRPYGLPRNDDVANPDVADIRHYGLNASAGGRDYMRNKRSKRSTRRIWKRAARRAGARQCAAGLADYDRPS